MSCLESITGKCQDFFFPSNKNLFWIFIRFLQLLQTLQFPYFSLREVYKTVKKSLKVSQSNCHIESVRLFLPNFTSLFPLFLVILHVLARFVFYVSAGPCFQSFQWLPGFCGVASRQRVHLTCANLTTTPPDHPDLLGVIRGQEWTQTPVTQTYMVSGTAG